MSAADQQIEEFVILDEKTKRYRAKHGWTTQKKYAKCYLKEDAEEYKANALTSGGMILKMEKVEEEE